MLGGLMRCGKCGLKLIKVVADGNVSWRCPSTDEAGHTVVATYVRQVEPAPLSEMEQLAEVMRIVAEDDNLQPRIPEADE